MIPKKPCRILVCLVREKRDHTEFRVLAALVGYFVSALERLASSSLFCSPQHLMLPLPCLMVPWCVGREHDKIVHLHKKETSQEGEEGTGSSLCPE